MNGLFQRLLAKREIHVFIVIKDSTVCCINNQRIKQMMNLKHLQTI